MKLKHRLSENILFWMAVVFLAMGAALTFYEQGQMALTVNSMSIFRASGSANHLAGKRQLPIYCVQTEKPQVALSSTPPGEMRTPPRSWISWQSTR